jgi:hypothetical protein
MHNVHTFGPKCKNYGIRVPELIWFTCERICKLNHESWAYLQKATLVLQWLSMKTVK